MKMTQTALAEAETRNIVKRWRASGLPLTPTKRRARPPADRVTPLREATLQEVSAEDRAALHHRIIYGAPVTLPPGTHEKVARLLTGRRGAEPAPPPAEEDLHTRLRKAATR